MIIQVTDSGICCSDLHFYHQENFIYGFMFYYCKEVEKDTKNLKKLTEMKSFIQKKL